MKQQAAFNNQTYEGHTGKVMLQLSKTYKGDSRFKLDQKFKDDIDVDKLPQKFKEIAQKGVIQSMHKKKKIKKDKPLIIQRFQPGTQAAHAIVKKAQGKKQFEQGLKRHIQKQNKKAQLQSGINKIKKAQYMLNKANNNNNTDKQDNDDMQKRDNSKPKFSITVNGSRKQAFKQTQFKLFG